MKNKIIRIIPKLDIKNGNLIKGINLEGLRVLGNPIHFAENYYNQGADEIMYLDNVATLYGTNNLTKFVKDTSKKIFIPLTVGGGIKNLNEIEQMLKNGADKISINSAAIDDINLIKKASKVFGSSTIVSNLECIKINNKYFISKSNGRDLVNKDPYDWSRKLEDTGLGEIFLTSVNSEGLQKGFDIGLIKKISKAVNIPVIASGGAGSFNDVLEVIKKTNIEGVSISSLFHYDVFSNFKFQKQKIGNFHFLETSKKKKSIQALKKLKIFLKNKGVNVR
jgi:imidazole glycerol-phosphate synthase subunit HisF